MESSESEHAENSSEEQALRQIARELSSLRQEMHSPVKWAMNSLMMELGGDPKEDREIERAEREARQVRLYRLIVVFAAISAIASVGSVVVAVANG